MVNIYHQQFPNVIQQISMGNKLRCETNDTNVECKWLEDSRRSFSIHDDLDNKTFNSANAQELQRKQTFQCKVNLVSYGRYQITQHVTIPCGIYLFMVLRATPSVKRCFNVSTPNIYLIKLVLV